MVDYDQFSGILKGADLIIGVDGGLNHLGKMGIAPSLMMGDFDSIESIETYKKIYPNADVKTFDARKDFTDSELAVREAINYRPDKIVLLSVTGNRLDHTLANMSLLKLIYDAGVEGVIIDGSNEIRYMEDELVLQGVVGSNMSLLPLSKEVTGINLEGFDYPLVDATLQYGSTTGISNVFVKEVGRIKIKSGRLLVIQSRD
jgi:thiamine pyrophosphokinase